MVVIGFNSVKWLRVMGQSIRDKEHFIEYLGAQWRIEPQKKAYVFLENGEDEGESITFNELFCSVNLAAFNLCENFEVSTGDVVIIALPTGVDFVISFFACLAIGAIPVPFHDTLKAQTEKLDSLIRGASANHVIARKNISDKFDISCSLIQSEKAVELVSISERIFTPQYNQNQIAYIQFTSGSSSEPKGVIISHSNLYHQMELLRNGFEQSHKSVILGWLPLYHDQGLVSNLLLPSYLGATSILMSPISFIQKPIRWLHAISKFKATTSGGPNFAFSLLSSIKNASDLNLDLSSWTTVFCGAEPIRLETIENFFSLFQPFGLHRSAFSPAYGMAESTLVVTRYRSSQGPKALDFVSNMDKYHLTEPAVSCGEVQSDLRVRIVCPESHTVLNDGEMGEVWLKGPSISGGYWRAGEIIIKPFMRIIQPSLESGYFATGDLGILANGELYITGRISDSFKLHGVKVFYHDIELTVKRSVDFISKNNGGCITFRAPSNEEEIILLLSIKPNVLARINTEAEFLSIYEKISNSHSLKLSKIVFIRDRLPVTTSGKIRRQEAWRSYLENKFQIIAECSRGSNDGNKIIKANEGTIRSKELDRFLKATEIVISPAFKRSSKLSDLGLTSIDFIKIQQYLEEYYCRSIELSELMTTFTGEQLSNILESRASNGTLESELAVNYEPKITCQMKNIIASNLIFGQSISYLYRALTVVGDLDVVKLKESFIKLTRRHPILLTKFVSRNGEPDIEYTNDTSSSFIFRDLCHNNELEPQAVATIVRDIQTGKVANNHLLYVFKLAEDNFSLFFAFHHGICDFWSLAIYLNELLTSYEKFSQGSKQGENGFCHETKATPFLDYQNWYQQYLSSDKYLHDKHFWSHSISKSTLESESLAEVFNITVTANSKLPTYLNHKILELSRRLKVTPNVIFMSAYELTLSLFSYSRNSVYQMALGNRNHFKYSNTIGLFANIISVSSSISYGSSAVDFLSDNQNNILAYLKHQSFPFSSLNGMKREHNEQVIEKSFFNNTVYAFHVQPHNLQNKLVGHLITGSDHAFYWNNLSIESLSVPHTKSINPFSFHVLRDDAQYTTIVECDDRHEPFVELFLDSYKKILEELVCHPNKNLGLITDEIRWCNFRPQSMVASEDTSVSCPFYLDRISQEMSESSETFILHSVDLNSPLTAREFYALAKSLAASLIEEFSISTGDVIAVEASRSMYSSLSCLAILMTGGVYMPLDFDLPVKRCERMLSKAKPKLIVRFNNTVEGFESYESIDLSKFLNSCNGIKACAPLPDVNLSDPAYLIFTSGTSGFPKGALISHEALSNRLHWMEEQLGINKNDIFLHKTSLSFDVSMWEILLPMMCGSKTVIIANGLEKSVQSIDKFMCEYQVSTVHFVPTMLSMWNRLSKTKSDSYALKRCICSGEQLLPTYVRDFKNKFGLKVDLYNFYGPTEAAIDVTFAKVTGENINIGSAARNCEILILDSDNNLLPKGIEGQLAISGIQVGLGYIDEPEVTASNFIDLPEYSSKKVYLTGDSAHEINDSCFNLIGRFDNQVKLNGFRIELDEILESLTRLECVLNAAVNLCKRSDGIEELVAHVVSSDSSKSDESIKKELAKDLPPYMIPSRIIRISELPLLPSGKTDSKLLAEEYELTQSASFNVLSSSYVPKSIAEETVIETWQDILGVVVCSLEDDFFQNGGDSIKALRLSAKLKEKGYLCLVEHVYQFRTLESILVNLEACDNTSLAIENSVNAFELLSDKDMKLIPKDTLIDAYPLSAVQQSIIYQYLNSSSYEIYVTFIKVGLEFDSAHFRNSVELLIERHPFMRASIQLENYHDVIQFIHKDIESSIEIVDLRDNSVEMRESRFDEWLKTEKKNHFKWDLAPLWRFTIHIFEDKVFTVTFSEVSMDGWCVATVMTELLFNYSRLYRGRPVENRRVESRYSDFVSLERLITNDPVHESFWKRVITDNHHTIVKKQSLMRTSGRSEKSKRNRVSNKIESIEKLNDIAQRAGVTIKQVLMSVHAAVISTLSGRNKISTGMEVNGRLEEQGGDEVVGVFNNMVPLFYDLNNLSWIELCNMSLNIEDKIMPFRRYPYTEMHKNNNGPIFDTLFVFTHFHNYTKLFDVENITIHDHYASDQTYIPLTAHFNLSVDKSHLSLFLDYESNMYTEAEAQRIAGIYKKAIAQCIEQPLGIVLNHTLVQEQVHSRDETIRELEDIPIQRLLQRSMKRFANRIALSESGRSLTYGELDKYSEIIAGRLLAKQGNRVIIWTDSDIESIVAIHACLKAGYTYIPIEKTTPLNRVKQIIDDCKPSHQLFSPVQKLYLANESRALR